MANKIESEKKFIVEFPKSWSELGELLSSIIDVRRIAQTYLKPKGDEPAARVRQTTQGLTGETKVIYEFNQKIPVEPGVHKEKEHAISEKQYKDFLKDCDPSKCEVKKTRFVFKYHNQIFELDVFKDHLNGLAILEIELKNIKDKVELPNYLKVIKDVTTDKRFTNYFLANKELHK